MFFNPLWIVFFCAPFLTGCTKYLPEKTNSACLVARRTCLQGKAIVEMVTSRGTILIEIDGDNAPLTAGNFLDLVDKDVYEQTLFHRVIRIPVPFILQGGDPFSSDPNTPKVNYGKGSFIDPDSGQARFIPLEIKLKGERLPRYNELIVNPKELLALQLRHQRGSIAMARSQRLDSASAQFYFALKPLPELDGRYSVFGRIVEGMDVLNILQEGDLIIKTKILLNQ